MPDYVYNDNDSTMPPFSEKFSSRIGDGSGHHKQVFHDLIQLIGNALSIGSMIDVVCGMGRTTRALAPAMKDVVALEPDAARWNYTRELVIEYSNAAVLNQTTQL